MKAFVKSYANPPLRALLWGDSLSFLIQKAKNQTEDREDNCRKALTAYVYVLGRLQGQSALNLDTASESFSTLPINQACKLKPICPTRLVRRALWCPPPSDAVPEPAAGWVLPGRFSVPHPRPLLAPALGPPTISLHGLEALSRGLAHGNCTHQLLMQLPADWPWRISMAPGLLRGISVCQSMNQSTPTEHLLQRPWTLGEEGMRILFFI